MGNKLWHCLFIGILVMERCFEIVVARRHEAWMRSLGGIEYGGGFSKALFFFHGMWFLAFGFEIFHRDAAPILSPHLSLFLLLFLQISRYWCIYSLGKFWNSKILVLPGASIVRRGPYRWLKHPNYLVVLIEIPLYPALFGCWLTSSAFGLMNALILSIRIRQEEEALARHTDFAGS